MRALMIALAIAGVAGAARAQMSPGGQDPYGEVRQPIPRPAVPSGARQVAEDAIRHDLGDRDPVTFRAERTSEVASIRHGAFAPPIDGPIALVCGQYTQDPNAEYAWFFVAMKRGHVLWTADAAVGSPDEAYYSCQGAGLAK